MRKEKGIAISLYDKFEDLSVLVDIIRENFDDEYFVAVSCSKGGGKEEIEDRGIEIDAYHDASNFEYSPEMTGVEKRIHLSSRIFNSIKESCKLCIDSGCNNVMHLHSDAWPLDEEKLNELIEEMEGQDKLVAAKGRGPAARTRLFPVGHVNDQFMIFSRKSIVEEKIFEINPVELLPDREIHTQLMLLLLGNIGWSNVLFYSDNSENIYWDGQNKDNTGVRPMMFNPKWDQLHLAVEDFPDNLGRSLQAHYLVEGNMEEGRNIQEFIEKYKDEGILAKLEDREKVLDKKIKKLGKNPVDFERNLVQMEEYATGAYTDLLKKRASNTAKNLAKFQLNFLSKSKHIHTFTDAFLNGLNQRKDPIEENWPDRSFNIYEENLDESKIPKKYRGVWKEAGKLN